MLNTEMVKTAQLVGAIAMFGGAFFALAVWFPAVRTLGRNEPLPDQSPLKHLPVLAGLGAAMLLLFGGLDLIRFARVAADQPLAVAGWQTLVEVATGTRYGRMLLLRGGIAMAVLLLVAVWGHWSATEHEDEKWGNGNNEPWPIREVLLAVFGSAALISFSLASHAAATPVHGSWPLLADAAHILAVGAWVGGLVLLALVPWRPLMDLEAGRRLLRQATACFSVIGMGAVVILTGTGIYMSSLRVYGPQALVETDYGIALLVKILLMAALVTVAAANRLIFLPGMQAAGDWSVKAAGWLWSLVRLEVILTVVAISFAADLTIFSPAEEPPVRVTIAIREDGIEPSVLDLPLGRTVLLKLENHTDGTASLIVRGFEHRLTRGPGAFRHLEMLSFPPPTDRFGLSVGPGKRVVAEFTPLAEGTFVMERRETAGGEGSTRESRDGQITVQGELTASP